MSGHSHQRRRPAEGVRPRGPDRHRTPPTGRPAHPGRHRSRGPRPRPPEPGRQSPCPPDGDDPGDLPTARSRPKDKKKMTQRTYGGWRRKRSIDRSAYFTSPCSMASLVVLMLVMFVNQRYAAYLVPPLVVVFALALVPVQGTRSASLTASAGGGRPSRTHRYRAGVRWSTPARSSCPESSRRSPPSGRGRPQRQVRHRLEPPPRPHDCDHPGVSNSVWLAEESGRHLVANWHNWLLDSGTCRGSRGR